ncbi:hypothetical protein R1flu_020363 [Riccia fluitans]|uniref:PLAT domain-containing protein n=1 Tax=Riccia fluitans TaxID=41844 RepID=A0ABD1ZMS5_9MARC
MGTSRGCWEKTFSKSLVVIQMGLSPALVWLLIFFPAASAKAAVNFSSTDTLQTKETANLEVNNEVCTYTVSTVTGKRAGSETDSVISLRLENSRDQSVYFSELDNGKRHFQRGHTDKFIMLGNCVSDLCKMTLYTDDSWDFGAWYVETVSVSVETPSGSEHRTWEVQDWLPRDDDAAELFLVVDDCQKENS